MAIRTRLKRDEMDSPCGWTAWVAVPGFLAPRPDRDRRPGFAGDCRDGASAAVINSAPAVSSTHMPSGPNVPVLAHKAGRPIHGISSRAALMILCRSKGVLSGLALASPAVTSEPLLFAATTR